MCFVNAPWPGPISRIDVVWVCWYIAEIVSVICWSMLMSCKKCWPRGRDIIRDEKCKNHGEV